MILASECVVADASGDESNCAWNGYVCGYYGVSNEQEQHCENHRAEGYIPQQPPRTFGHQIGDLCH
jgi:hypothetical protein